jgi:hypothetical protein
MGDLSASHAEMNIYAGIPIEELQPTSRSEILQNLWRSSAATFRTAALVRLNRHTVVDLIWARGKDSTPHALLEGWLSEKCSSHEA